MADPHDHHYRDICANCGSVTQCRCMGPKVERMVPYCPGCEGQRYSYDRTAMGPASRVKDSLSYLRSAARPLQQAKGVLSGVAKELELTSKHTHDPTLRSNHESAAGFAERVTELDKELSKLLPEIDRFTRVFK
jgi:hypothetical protein